MLTKLAVRYLTKQLRKDEGFWLSYQANIAMCIYDNFGRYFDDFIPKKTDLTLHEFCNICADDFLRIWTGKIKETP